MRRTNGIYCILVVVIFLLNGCGFKINYKLNTKDIILTEDAKPLKVQVATFTDKRNILEKDIAARKRRGDSDISDYTYDNGFQGNVAEEITKMAIKHLNYSKVFVPEIQPALFTSEQLSTAKLNSLKKNGVDAVMTGEINHFYGYYDYNLGRQLLYGVPLGILSGMLLNVTIPNGDTKTTYYFIEPGIILGGYLESQHKRSIKQHVKLKARLISTTTYQPLWEDNFEIITSEKKSMPFTGQYKVTLMALRDVVNKMVESLEKSPLDRSKSNQAIAMNQSESLNEKYIGIKKISKQYILLVIAPGTEINMGEKYAIVRPSLGNEKISEAQVIKIDRNRVVLKKIDSTDVNIADMVELK